MKIRKVSVFMMLAEGGLLSYCPIYLRFPGLSEGKGLVLGGVEESSICMIQV